MEYVEIARTETERGELVLRERREEGSPSVLELRANGVFVMDSQETSTEQALADAALELVEEPHDVLVGGLGLGYTMHRVLADHRVERCSVVEIEQALVDWMRDGTIPHGPALLADERANPVVADLAVALLEAPESSYDLVLMDVDNGPDQLVHEENEALYRQPFLEQVHRVLRPGGAVVVWAAEPSIALEATLRSVFGNAESRGYEVKLQERDEQYWLHVARVPSAA
jgi:spermidine synthase